MDENIEGRLQEGFARGKEGKGWPSNKDASALWYVPARNAQPAQPSVAALQERHGEISCPWALQNKGKRKEEKEDLDFQKGASHDPD